MSSTYFKRKILILLFPPDDSDMIFSLDEDHLENVTSDNATRTCVGNPATLSGTPVQKPRPRSPLRLKSFTHRRKHVRIFSLKKYIYIYI